MKKEGRKLIKGKHLNKSTEGEVFLLPPKEGTCETCGVNHDPKIPHNQQSLFYQYNFYNKNGKWPTWKDAMTHCDDITKKRWIEALKEKGVKVE